MDPISPRYGPWHLLWRDTGETELGGAAQISQQEIGRYTDDNAERLVLATWHDELPLCRLIRWHTIASSIFLPLTDAIALLKERQLALPRHAFADAEESARLIASAVVACEMLTGKLGCPGRCRHLQLAEGSVERMRNPGDIERIRFPLIASVSSLDAPIPLLTAAFPEIDDIEVRVDFDNPMIKAAVAEYTERCLGSESE